MLSLLFLYVVKLLQGNIFLLGFISNNNSFPKPLSLEDEKKYLLQFKLGDLKAKNILIEHNLRLVAHIAKKYCNSTAEIDDYISIGTIGLIKAISSFELDKGTKLVTYAARCIENEILMYLRCSKKYNSDLYLEDPIGSDKDGNIIDLLEIIKSDDVDICEKVDLKLQIKALYDKMKNILKDREKLVIELRYGLFNKKCRTQIEIAKLLGISRSYVSRIEKKAIKKLHKSFLE